ncbi:MAG TPA: phosphoribosylformylglycinamidine synthase I [Phycisphaerae bacterium]|jgi:phosphoribosylformylglycinamidine synthase I|nr:phosphoribosylformylglycinamidine synthase I [Phycisphaerae bacterium]HOB76599.1 phosphoribosylformylglycinamidine synthase I [Phycisphaerae bacterium]HOJ54801.1 phosphoribosylformylglycinamidine synthase I [Phycisphaerae bacterium]HOL26921.1 phosphoribosylformylglycinamidine synthase I [Phycisphaerae bacterium]HPP20876.1 phosphoribosylformylglycinamidine synthase I [Phycisphaerae bacterium]
MNRPKVLVLRTAGTNCDQETVYAWELAGAEPERIHVRELIESPSILDRFAILTIPGGFSYGDDISAGKILAMQLIHHLAEPLRRFVDSGRLVLGICNGFQVLVKAGLLPGFAPDGQSSATEPAGQTVTLTNNDSARFEARWVYLRSSARPNAFLPDERILALPVAHGEGKLVAANDEVRRRLHSGGHIALTYCDAQGRPGPYPINPNGSHDDIAGLVDATGRILGLMPHPERHVDPRQHPEWTSRQTDEADGRIIFQTAVKNAR